jgi:electron transport complex protein RnfB
MIIDLLIPVILMLLVAISCGSLLGYAVKAFKTDENPLEDQINDLLPQTQCGQCGHPGCRPYAKAIAEGGPINRCPPGGEATISALAALLNVAFEPLDAEHGVEDIRRVAYIHEEECIGCTKCIQACPVDAILGAAKFMHTVIVQECTGCDLCIEPCPVDCIDMIPAKDELQRWNWQLPESLIITSDRRQQICQ